MATSPVILDEEALIKEQIDQVAMPAGVKLKRVELGSDWTGEPAATIYLSVSARIPLTQQRLDELSELKRKLFERIVALRLVSYPFFMLLESK